MLLLSREGYEKKDRVPVERKVGWGFRAMLYGVWSNYGVLIRHFMLPENKAADGGKGKKRNKNISDTVYCLLSTVYCLLSTVYCLMSTVYCVLSIVYCLDKSSHSHTFDLHNLPPATSIILKSSFFM